MGELDILLQGSGDFHLLDVALVWGLGVKQDSKDFLDALLYTQAPDQAIHYTQSILGIGSSSRSLLKVLSLKKFLFSKLVT